MSRERIVSEAGLRTLLEDPETADAALQDYFDVVPVGAFRFEYRLRDDVELRAPPGQVPRGAGRNLLIAIANRVVRNTRAGRYRDALVLHPNRVRIVSEGDSWYQHPLIDDVIDQLSGHYNILSLGAAGDTLENMIREGEYRDAIDDEAPTFFLLSGGGNDVLGEGFADFLNAEVARDSAAGPPRLLHPAFFRALDALIDRYRAICLELEGRAPGLRVVTHGYDYVAPRRGGDWLGGPLRERGIGDGARGRAVVRFIVDELNRRLTLLSGSFRNLRHIDLRGRVPDVEWYDEIHPDASGFSKIAGVFRRVIDSA